jgi:hypothetical protein
MGRTSPSPWARPGWGRQDTRLEKYSVGIQLTSRRLQIQSMMRRSFHGCCEPHVIHDSKTQVRQASRIRLQEIMNQSMGFTRICMNFIPTCQICSQCRDAGGDHANLNHLLTIWERSRRSFQGKRIEDSFIKGWKLVPINFLYYVVLYNYIGNSYMAILYSRVEER